jgi:hypothetical protein
MLAHHKNTTTLPTRCGCRAHASVCGHVVFSQSFSCIISICLVLLCVSSTIVSGQNAQITNIDPKTFFNAPGLQTITITGTDFYSTSRSDYIGSNARVQLKTTTFDADGNTVNGTIVCLESSGTKFELPGTLICQFSAGVCSFPKILMTDTDTDQVADCAFINDQVGALDEEGNADAECAIVGTAIIDEDLTGPFAVICGSDESAAAATAAAAISLPLSLFLTALFSSAIIALP